MIEIVNKIEHTIIYIDSGTYDYSGIGVEDSETGGYFNRTLNLIGYFSGPSVKTDDKNSYPVIISNISSGSIVFYLYKNVSASFQCLKFIIGINSHLNRRLIMSFYLFIIFYYFFLFFF
jgi:hypothetical protein